MTKIHPSTGEDWELAKNLQKQERFSEIPPARILEAVRIAEGHGGVAAQLLAHGDVTAAPEAPPSETVPAQVNQIAEGHEGAAPEALTHGAERPPSEPASRQVNKIAEGHEGAAPEALAHGAERPPSEPASPQAPCAEPPVRQAQGSPVPSPKSKQAQGKQTQEQEQQAFKLIEQQATKFNEEVDLRQAYYQCNVCCGWGCWSRMDLLVDGLDLRPDQEKSIWKAFDYRWMEEKKSKSFSALKRYFRHCESEKVFIACAVRGAAKAGNMAALRWLRDARLWRPRDLEQAQWAVGGADAGGHLLVLLGHFDLTVPRTLAEMYKERVSKIFKDADEQFDEIFKDADEQFDDRLGESVKSEVAKRKWAPEFYATLLANFIRVNHAVANELMQSAVVSSKQMCVHYDKQEAHALSEGLDFPRTLGAIFVRQDGNLTNHLEKEEVSAEGHQNMPNLTLDDSAKTVRRSKREENLPLSKWMAVTLPQEERFSALIPTEATHFAYVYPNGVKDWLRGSPSEKKNLGKTTGDESMEAEGQNNAEEEEEKEENEDEDAKKPDFLGGFLYATRCDPGYQPKNLNFISFDKGDFAFVFGRGTLVEKKDGDKIGASEKDAWHRTTVKALTNEGVLQYRWVEPEKSMEEMRGYGGFAYKCKGDKYYYFKLASTGQVVTRGRVLWEMNAIEVKRKNFSTYAKKRFENVQAKDLVVIDVLKAIITPMSWNKRFRMAAGALGTGQHTFESAINFGKPVRFARINVPGAINPLLLFAIATTPRESVANTIGAKAITCAAYNSVYVLYFTDFILEICCIFFLARISVEFRGRQENQMELFQSPFIYSMSLFFVSVLWLKNFLTELLLLMSFFWRGWMYAYIAWRWLSLLNLTLLLLVAFSVLHKEAAQGTLHHWQRVVVSIAMSSRVLKAMSFLGTMETCRFGQHILPVTKSIAHSLSFGITLAFALVSAWSLFWGLSNRKNFDTFASIFRLGLLGDFDVDEDLHGILEEEEGEDYHVPESYYLEWIAFMGTSVFFTLSLMNIFIGIMGAAYDHFQDRVVELFVRNRAQVCTVYVLWLDALYWTLGCCCCCVKSDDSVSKEFRRQIWCCYHVDDDDPGQQEDDVDAEESEASMRKLIKRESKRLKRDLVKEITEIRSRTGAVPKIAKIEKDIRELKDGQKLLLQELKALRSGRSAHGGAAFVS